MPKLKPSATAYLNERRNSPSRKEPDFLSRYNDPKVIDGTYNFAVLSDAFDLLMAHNLERAKKNWNWKFPITGYIPKDQFDACNAAAIFFTGGSIELVAYRGSPKESREVLVRGEGYYHHIGA